MSHPSDDVIGTKRVWIGDSPYHTQVYVKVEPDLWQMEDFPVLHADDDMMVGCEVMEA